MRIREAQAEDIPILVELSCKLWPDATELLEEIPQIMETGAFFLACEGESAVGFAQCQLRHDYVEGTETSPVGYLEGIYVAEVYRRQGAAKALLTACEQWAKTQGCREFASDCQIGNLQSLQFHLGAGFEEANRIICFTKKL